MVIGINLVNQILLGIIEIVYIVMIGNHQDEQMHEVQMTGEYLMLILQQLLGPILIQLAKQKCNDHVLLGIMYLQMLNGIEYIHLDDG